MIITHIVLVGILCTDPLPMFFPGYQALPNSKSEDQIVIPIPDCYDTHPAEIKKA